VGKQGGRILAVFKGQSAFHQLLKQENIKKVWGLKYETIQKRENYGNCQFYAQKLRI
jgi:hypothetical protein